MYPLLLEKPIHGNDLSSEYLTFYEWHSDSDQCMSEFGDWWASPHNSIGNQTEIAEVDPPSTPPPPPPPPAVCAPAWSHLPDVICCDSTGCLHLCLCSYTSYHICNVAKLVALSTIHVLRFPLLSNDQCKQFATFE